MTKLTSSAADAWEVARRPMTDSTCAGLTKEAKALVSDLNQRRSHLSSNIYDRQQIGKAADLIEAQGAEIARLTGRLSNAYRVKAECNDIANEERRCRLDAEATLASQAARVEADARRIAELQEALQPFVREVSEWHKDTPDEVPIEIEIGSIDSHLTFGDLRRARALLNPDASEATK